VLKVKPTQVTLVPDPPGLLTSNAGWNLALGGVDWLRDVLAELSSAGIRTSLFLEPDPNQVRRAQEMGANRVELYTGPYAAASGHGATRFLRRIARRRIWRAKSASA